MNLYGEIAELREKAQAERSSDGGGNGGGNSRKQHFFSVVFLTADAQSVFRLCERCAKHEHGGGRRAA